MNWDNRNIVNYKAELALKVDSILTEGPSWDEDKEVLYWVDIEGKKVHIFNPQKKVDKEIAVDQYVGAAVPTKSGELLLAMKNGFYFLNLENGHLTFISNPEQNKPFNRFNDGKCDCAGRFFAGTMSLNETDPTGALYCLETDRKIRKVLENVTISNGITWSPDNRTMYYIDSPNKCVDAFDYDPEDGTISNRRTIIVVEDGVPDGMTSDSEGMLWIAHWGGWQVSRWDPYKRKQIGSVKLPVEKVSSCVFGGAALDELYITTARKGNVKGQPDAGGIFIVNPNVKGIPTYKYGR
ncbi:SMP-30/gluconolactonase/LRE family protein [Athalassotoga saccharophila]|uniref:SMP-30/gluconolactonase/LRE family protein n=1 Tax=Athalassotoga saccharophila TaxID=1441386 RepID=UPI0018D6A0F1|nr:SMP-30/gluconolactonase/LRE family protein [Athalassotoga saccharophila]BBJ27402.1 gluconolactonase [Athalassotoga saccharophila]